MTGQTKSIINKLLLFSGIILLVILLMQPLEVFLFFKDIAVLFPKGLIAVRERNLLLLLQIYMLIFVLPVFAFTFLFSWWFRADNDKSTYDPHLIDNKLAEVVWWGLPLVMTAAVSVITWIETHRLDPYKPIVSENKTIPIQVVALQWNWLFIYPEEEIASMNHLQIPKNTPIHFFVTADAPMNSFWIPDLGGQIYAMPGMRTELHLIANEEGSFRGSSANISGEGFAGMTFVTKATSEKAYKDWLDSVKQANKKLTFDEYTKIAAPSLDHPLTSYQLADKDLFHKILMKFMKPKKD